MKAFRLHSYDGPPALTLDEIPSAIERLDAHAIRGKAVVEMTP